MLKGEFVQPLDAGGVPPPQVSLVSIGGVKLKLRPVRGRWQWDSTWDPNMQLTLQINGWNPGRLTAGSPTNHPFRKENDLPNLHDEMFHVNLQGCIPFFLGGGGGIMMQIYANICKYMVLLICGISLKMSFALFFGLVSFFWPLQWMVQWWWEMIYFLLRLLALKLDWEKLGSSKMSCK